jgi:hypothetical protein
MNIILKGTNLTSSRRRKPRSSRPRRRKKPSQRSPRQLLRSKQCLGRYRAKGTRLVNADATDEHQTEGIPKSGNPFRLRSTPGGGAVPPPAPLPEKTAEDVPTTALPLLPAAAPIQQYLLQGAISRSRALQSLQLIKVEHSYGLSGIAC